MVDKNLFLYDLAVVAIMKNEAPYVKEWLDYHLAAGVEHFFIYDHESSDNLKEVLQPYIDAEIVTYILYPDEKKQCEAYIDAYKAYRFFCRYIAFIDADEFIFPQSNKSIVEVTDEILNSVQDPAALEIQWMMYGSNNLETADYSKGVLERFTRRAAKLDTTIKTIANPRKIKYLVTPHYMFCFADVQVLIESKKILINHYQLKSREEFANKNNNFKGDVAYGGKYYYNASRFSHEINNDVFDDSILAYRDARRQMGGAVKPLDYERLINALIENLAPLFNTVEVPLKFFECKMETFLTCRALASFLKGNVLDTARGEMVEQTSLQAIYSTMFTETSFGNCELLMNELPNLLQLNYPIVQDILKGCLNFIPQMQNMIQSEINDPKKMMFWVEFNNYDNLYRMLKAFENK